MSRTTIIKGDLRKMVYDISNWTMDDIINLPKVEDDFTEFKSGETPSSELKYKISKAASAFSNTGSGLFIIGVDTNGNLNGIGKNVGRQAIRDWIDQIIDVEPKIDYKVKTIEPESSSKIIAMDKCVVVIQMELLQQNLSWIIFPVKMNKDDV
jgi:hypothetical protein